tara:strand:+ start:816 stop:1229 length:414 start_codon:yes stop_codon:yes gene_type:complete
MRAIKFLSISFELIFLLLGVYYPLAKMKEFWIFKSEFSILSISYDFFVNEELALFFVVFFFGFVFPVLKIISRILKINFVERFNLHKFSMVDIFLISFLVFIGKSSNFFDIQLGIGFYFLIFSIFLGYFQILLSRNL